MAYGGLNKKWMPPRKSGGILRVSTINRFSPSVENEQADAGTGRPGPSRETKFSGTNGDRETVIFSVQLAMRRIGNLTRLIHALLCDDHILCGSKSEIQISLRFRLTVCRTLQA